MTKLEKLQKEHRDTLFDIMTEDGSPEMHDALHKKLKRIEDEILKEQIRIGMRGGRK